MAGKGKGKVVKRKWNGINLRPYRQGIRIPCKWGKTNVYKRERCPCGANNWNLEYNNLTGQAHQEHHWLEAKAIWVQGMVVPTPTAHDDA